ncbi:MAG: beta-propeller domain-containing protein [Sphingomonas sp.]
MRKFALALAVSIWIGACAAPAAPAAAPQARAMRAFESDRQFIAFMRRVAPRERVMSPPPVVAPAPPPPPSAAEPAVVVTAMSAQAQDVTVTGTKSTSITNTQEADVDEGGIVKVAGEHLVILRRGRLFTVSLAGNRMRNVDHIDAFPPGSSGHAWYDEMLVSGDRIVVVGYSYERGGTEINRFRIAPNGRLAFEDSYHLRSNDYYSSTNYASRLVGSTLIFYTPLDLDTERPLAALPGLQRWTGKPQAPFARTLPITKLYVPEPLRRKPGADLSTLHTVTLCDLAAPRLACRATAVLGSYSRTFYVSGAAVYVWTDGDRTPTARSGAFVYRLPLDGSPPGAVQAWGGPVDQFSFAEDRAAKRLSVVVRADSAGDAMWRPEHSEGAAALLTLSLAAFGNGSRVMNAAAYRSLPAGEEAWSFHNRFVGRHLIYSAGRFNEHRGTSTVYAVPLSGGAIARIAVPHGVDRLDIIGADAIAIGNDAKERLGFSAIELADRSRLGDSYFLPAAHEGERRSQAFFFRPDEGSADGASGMLGLPVTRDLGNSPVARFLGSGSAVAFLRRDARRFSPAGELVANAEGARDDACKASCVDWYGNARPIFLNDRLFALMGYELVEGRVAGGLVGERARLDFAPVGGR